MVRRPPSAQRTDPLFPYTSLFLSAVMASRLMLAAGGVQRSKEGVIHLRATHIVDRTAMLDTLGSERRFDPEACPADEVGHPQPPRGHAVRHGHPRHVRILPTSRDFP